MLKCIKKAAYMKDEHALQIFMQVLSDAPTTSAIGFDLLFFANFHLFYHNSHEALIKFSSAGLIL